MSTKRFYELDVLRFIAALVVVFFHYTFAGYAQDQLSPVEFPAISQISRYGYLGVDLFFIISGFVILLSAWGRTLERFAISRIVRLYPAYWFACTLTFAVVTACGAETFQVTPMEYIYNMSMVHEAFYIPSVDGVYWTLFVEIRFYLLIAALLTIRQISRIEYFLTAWLAVAVLSYFGVQHKVTEFFLIPDWASYFIAGCLFFLIRDSGLNVLRIGLLLASYLMSVLWGIERIEIHSENLQAYFNPVIMIAIVTVFHAIFLGIALKKFDWLNFKKAATLGALTYPLYLVHQVLGYLLLSWLDTHISPMLNLLLTIGCMMVLSIFICKVVEPALGKRLKNVVVLLLDWAKFRFVNVFQSRNY